MSYLRKIQLQTTLIIDDRSKCTDSTANILRNMHEQT